MLIKICGNTELVNLQQVASLNPDFMGFIYYPQSTRDISSVIDKLSINSLPKTIGKVLVTVDMPLDELKTLVKRYDFDYVQLHGSETPNYCTEIRKYTKVIKAFALSNRLPIDTLKEFENKVDIFLFDTDGKLAGGNGHKFKHSILEQYPLKTPFLLAGGIGPDDAEYIKSLKLQECIGIDLNSRFEIEPGIKNIEVLKNFINKIKP